MRSRVRAVLMVLVMVGALTVAAAPTANAAIEPWALGTFPVTRGARDARDFWSLAVRNGPRPAHYDAIDPQTANRGGPVNGFSARDFTATGQWPALPAYRITGGRIYRFFFHGRDPSGTHTDVSDRWIGFGGEWTNWVYPSSCPNAVGQVQPPITGTTGPFYEYDIAASWNQGRSSVNYLGGQHRGVERLVWDASTGNVYYTNDHYCHFVLVP
jgi:ribonuclease